MSHRLRWSVLGWLVYAVAHVAISGVVLDETVIAGQVISGDVVYPAGHPHDSYFRTTFSLSHFVSAALLSVGFDVEGASFFRNVVFLFLSAITPFLAAVALTRRVAAGHLAAALTLFGAAASFGGLYPVWVFPDFYSNGHVGLCLAVCLLALAFLERWRTAGLLFGLLPSLHGAMALMAWPAMTLVLLLRLVRGEGLPRRRFVVAALAGGAVSAALGVYISVFTAVPPPVPPFATDLTATTVRETLMVAGHRGAIPWSDSAYWLNPLLFVCAGVLIAVFVRGRDVASRRALEGFVLLGAIAWVTVVVMHAWRLAGTPPEVLVILMPGRFSNVTQALLVPMAVAAVVHGVAGLPLRRRVVLGAGLATAVVALAVLGSGVPFDGRVQVARHALILTLGAAIGLGVVRWRGLGRGGRLAVVAVGLAVVGSQIPLWDTGRMALYGALAGVLVVAGHAGARRWPRRAFPPTARVARMAPLAAAALAAVATLEGRRADFMDPTRARWDVISEDDRLLAGWFAEHTDDDALVLTPWTWHLPEAQGKYGRPVVVKFETPWFSTYRPDLAPMIDVLVEDLYGVEFPPPRPYGSVQGDPTSVWNPAWEAAWSSRPVPEWRRLAARFSFRHLVAPTDWELSLTPAFVGREFSIYVID